MHKIFVPFLILAIVAIARIGGFPEGHSKVGSPVGKSLAVLSLPDPPPTFHPTPTPHISNGCEDPGFLDAAYNYQVSYEQKLDQEFLDTFQKNAKPFYWDGATFQELEGANASYCIFEINGQFFGPLRDESGVRSLFDHFGLKADPCDIIWVCQSQSPRALKTEGT